jgi:type VI secretion system protein ImpA
MSIDTEKLLEPISVDNPCGDNLEYDTVAMELETVAKGRPATQWDAGEAPDWRQVKSLCLDLLGRTMDFRFAVQLARASVQTDGYEGFRDCLKTIMGYLEQYWDEVHPQLDPDDDNDPMFRVNAISSLSDRETLLEVLEGGALAAAQGIGNFTYRDLLLAQGERQAVEGEETPDRGLIDAAYMGCDLDELKARGDALNEACQLAQSIETTLTDKVGAGQACSLDGLVKQLKEIAAAVDDGLAKRGVTVESNETGDEAGAGGGMAGGAAAAGLNGVVQNRQDVIKAVDKILDYYRSHEPSSPIPLLLKGAKRLTTMSFLEIVNDVTPEGLEQLKSIAGITGIDMEETPTPAASESEASGW